MIRNPLQAAVGCTRPDLARVADSIAASLRQFSVSARRSAGSDGSSNSNSNSNDNDNDGPRRPTGRQRAAAAFDELLSSVDAANSTFATSSASRPTTDATTSSPLAPSSRRPNVISVTSLRGGANFRKTGNNDDFGSDRPNVIRGGFRGRGRGWGGSSFASSERGGGGGGGGFGGGMRRGRGGGFRSDDRPRRARSSSRDGGEGRRWERRAKDESSQQQNGPPAGEYTPEVKAYLEARDEGTTEPFNPSVSLESLMGWGPGVASSTPLGQSEMVLRQARILGSGLPYHSRHYAQADALRTGWRDGTGIFIPPSDEGKLWTRQVMKDRPLEAPAEVKTAVMQTTLLGQYEGPKYADPNDTLGTMRSYLKRDSTWNARAERAIEAKISSLLGKPRPKPDGAKAQPGPKA